MRILLDTNFLVLPFTKKVDVVELIKDKLSGEIYITDFCLNEINNLKEKKAIKDYLNLKNVRILKTGYKGDADKHLVELSLNNVICTQDALLRKKIMKKGGKVAYLRNNKYIEKNF